MLWFSRGECSTFSYVTWLTLLAVSIYLEWMNNVELVLSWSFFNGYFTFWVVFFVSLLLTNKQLRYRIKQRYVTLAKVVMSARESLIIMTMAIFLGKSGFTHVWDNCFSFLTSRNHIQVVLTLWVCRFPEVQWFICASFFAVTSFSVKPMGMS